MRLITLFGKVGTVSILFALAASAAMARPVVVFRTTQHPTDIESNTFVKIVQAKTTDVSNKPTGVIVRDPNIFVFSPGNVLFRFDFNDNKDIRQFVSGEKGFVSPLEDDTIDDCIESAIKGAPAGDLEKIKYVISESSGPNREGGGKLDLRFHCDFYDDDRLYVIDRIAYNPYDLGNYLWGAAMARLGLSYTLTKIGSELNAVFFTYKQNPDLKKPWLGIALGGDSVEDQQAINNGYYGRFGRAR